MRLRSLLLIAAILTVPFAGLLAVLSALARRPGNLVARRVVCRRAAALAVACLMLAGCGRGPDRSAGRVRLATTTSTENSGLLQHLLPPFEAREGIEVQVLAVGTGQALALGERGDVDVLLVHAREREEAFMAAGHGAERRDVMWNDFVLLGPPGDPAGVQGLDNVVAALGRIARHGAQFVSRGDDSGTHIRETALWELAGGVPDTEPFYLSAGQGMGSCLILASEKGAYLLADRGTYLVFAPRLELGVLVEGDPRLRNPYSVILVGGGNHPGVQVETGRRLMDYLTSQEGQARIASFRVNGQRLFHPVSPPR